MIDVRGKIVTIVGRVAAASTADVKTALAASGGVFRRGQPRHHGVLVVGAFAFGQLASGGLRRKLKKADECGAACISESMFLEALGLIKTRQQAAGVVDLEDLPQKTGLDLDTLRLLVLFDIIQPLENQCSFRDLVAAKEVARLLHEGASLGQIIEGAKSVAQRKTRKGAQTSDDVDQPLARLKLVSDECGKIVNQVGGMVADLDGQMRLPLPDADNPAIDELFEAAEEAEWLGELSVATTLYQRCMRLDRRDPIAPFNLANVLRERGHIDAAIFHLRIAIGLDQHFPDAWYNLALLMDGQGEKAAAKEGFEKAIEADGSYGDPVYNLAQLYFDDGDYDQAGQLWARYLTLDPDSEWARRARYGLALCRRQQEMGG